MSAAGVMMKFPVNKLPGNVSQSHRDITEDKYRDLRRPRKVVFYCNGDRYFKGKRLNITPHRYLTFNDLLFDLTGKLPGGVHLPYGVRQIYTPVGGRRVKEIEDLQDGNAYVCAGFEPFKTIKYGTEQIQPWSIGKPHMHEFYGLSPEYGASGNNRGGFQNAFQPHRVLRQTYPLKKQPGTFGNRAGYGSFWGQHGSDQGLAAMRPRMVTVVRHGPTKPRAVVKMLLNRRSVQSYEQMMKDIAEAFGPNWKNNKVKKLFSIKGREVQGVSDFFRDDDIFIGVGNESLTVSDVQDILEEIYPDSPYAKNVLKEWDRSQRKKHRVRVEGDTSVEQKRDSGLGSDGSNKDEGDEVIYKGSHKKHSKYPYANEPDLVARMEKERQRAALEERERVQRRMQKRIEAEQKALDEEKRKRGLPPIQKKDDRSSRADSDKDASKEKKRKSKEETSPVIVVVKGSKEDKKRLQAEAEAKKKREREAAERQRQQDLEDQRKEAEEAERKKRRAEEKRKAKEEEERKLEEERKREKEKERARKAEEEKKKKEEKEKKEVERRRREKEEAEKQQKEKEFKEKEKKLKDKEKRLKEKEKEADQKMQHAIEEEERLKHEREQAEKERAEEELKKEEEERKKEEEEERRRQQEEEEKKREEEKRRKEEEEKKREEEAMLLADDSQENDGKLHSIEEKSKESTRASDQHEPEPIAKREPTPKKKPKSKVIIHKTKLERQVSNAQHVLDKYVPGRVLGDGNFAVVKQCQLKNIGTEYAMKIIEKSKLKGKEHMIENEIDVMKACNHPNIVKLNEEFETKDQIYLIMELVKGGDLFDAITQSVKFSEPDAAGMASDLAQALFYLHSRHVVHRDMKPENLLVCRNVDGTISLKLADFGLAMEVKEPIYTVCGTPTYVAPEILSEIGYGLEVDMWALGVITYILLCGFPPFRSPDRNQTELFEFIKAGEYEFLSPYWDNISKTAKDLIEHLLIVEKKKRYTAMDVLCHPWIFTQGGAIPAPENIQQHRKNLRKELELQAKNNLENYRNRSEEST